MASCAARPPPTHAPAAPDLPPLPQEECLLAPWRQGGPPPAYRTVAVSVESLGELQRHVDAAAGAPTVLLVRAPRDLRPGSGLVIGSADVVVTTAAAWDADAPFEGPGAAVSCGGLKTLITIT